MGQISAKLRRVTNGYSYWCQGCGRMHIVRTDGAETIWSFDGNVNAPTFTPSVLITSGHYVPSHVPGTPCWCTYSAANPARLSNFKCGRCHTLISGGMVQFLADCTHALAGQTLPLPDLPRHLRD